MQSKSQSSAAQQQQQQHEAEPKQCDLKHRVSKKRTFAQITRAPGQAEEQILLKGLKRSKAGEYVPMKPGQLVSQKSANAALGSKGGSLENASKKGSTLAQQQQAPRAIVNRPAFVALNVNNQTSHSVHQSPAKGLIPMAVVKPKSSSKPKHVRVSHTATTAKIVANKQTGLNQNEQSAVLPSNKAVKDSECGRYSSNALNKSMVQIPSAGSRRESALLQRNDDVRSQRSASVDVRCSVPFSIAESPLQRPEDYDSAHASIHDWLDEFKRGGGELIIGQVETAAHLLTTTSPCGLITPEFEFTEQQPAVAFKLPEMHDQSELDALNQAIIIEHSMVNPCIGNGVLDVQSKLDDLQVEQHPSFNLAEMMRRDEQVPGRKTQTVTKMSLMQSAADLVAENEGTREP